MSKLSVTPVAKDDAKQNAYMQEFARRIEATPPGMCPVALQLSLLQTSGCQTCGKCTPCREGIPQLKVCLKQFSRLKAPLIYWIPCVKRHVLFVILPTALSVGMPQMCFSKEWTRLPAEYESHVTKFSCQEGNTQTVPCETMCPAHVDVPAYIALVGEGDYAGAINMIRKDNPFPTACAFVCEHPCEERCRRTLDRCTYQYSRH